MRFAGPHIFEAGVWQDGKPPRGLAPSFADDLMVAKTNQHTVIACGSTLATTG
jgi:hypothetical protein